MTAYLASQAMAARSASTVSRGLRATLLSVAIVSMSAAAATAQSSDDLQQLFQQVLTHPTDLAINMRYAKEAERKGELRKALSTYERILLNDPNNAAVRAEYERVKALLEPNRTRYMAGFGFQYETNVKLEDRHQKDAGAAMAMFRIDDDRRLGSTMWRSAMQVYGDVHTGAHGADLMYGNASTGPVWLMDNGWHFHPTVNGEVGFADYDFLFYSAGLGAEFDTRGAGALRSIALGASYADFSNSNNSQPFEATNGRDAAVLGAKIRLAWDNVFTNSDGFDIRPGAIYNIARDSQYRFWQVGTTALYIVGIGTFGGGVGGLYLSPEVTVQYRDYAGDDGVHTQSRRDVRVAPGARLIGAYENMTVVLSYLYDRNFSNYDSKTTFFAHADGKDYVNHRIGLNFYWDF